VLRIECVGQPRAIALSILGRKQRHGSDFNVTRGLVVLVRGVSVQLACVPQLLAQ
jgi:hypothetical protein